MNRTRQTVSKQLIIALGFLMTIGLFAQEETKTYQERFIVTDDAVLDINTSYADIEFETWDKEEVSITAIITLEGATKEEAENYFKNDPIEMIGNTKKVIIKSRAKNTSFFTGLDSSHNLDFDVQHFDFPDVREFVVNMPPLPELPPLPISKNVAFDYKAYKKHGDKYMKKWQKNFEKSFDKKHLKEIEEWAVQVEKQAAKIEEKHLAVKKENYEKRRAKLLRARAHKMEAHAHKMEDKTKRLANQHRLLEKEMEDTFIFINDDLQNLDSDQNIFFFSNEGDKKSFKIKKTIKIKLPKSTRIKLDVRHGEVKLAENTKNLNAKLSYSSLLANHIEGVDTNVSCSYSPVSVLSWIDGQLSTNYSDAVSLLEVTNMQLQANSSEVVIDKLLKSAFIQNSFGPLEILTVGDEFKELDISLKNAELNLKLPEVATTIYLKGNASSITKPSLLKLTETSNGNSKISKGFHIKNGSNRSIIITSDYSEVIIH